MSNADALVGNPASDNSKSCLAKAEETYVVYLPAGGRVALGEPPDNPTEDWAVVIRR